MNHPPRPVEDCPHRSPIAGGDAHCGLVARAVGAENAGLTRVGRDACEACTRSFPPTLEEPNPVVSSILYRVTAEILDKGGVPGCDRERAGALNLWAARNIPDESDVAEVRDDSSAPLDRLIPRPIRRSGPRVRSWSVGVLTAPRGVPTLGACLAGLVRAGWDSPRLFVDGDAAIPPEFAHLPTTVRSPKIGAWPNYYLGLAEMLMREPEADAYLMLEDDALLADDPGLRAYLERVLWPGPRPGIASLFCSRAYTRERAGWSAFEGVWSWCALAFVFERDTLRRFVADAEVLAHRWTRSDRNPLADQDWRVGRWAHDRGVPVYYPTPSLVQHIGEVSALWPGLRLHGERRASWFAGRSGADGSEK